MHSFLKFFVLVLFCLCHLLNPIH
uniref:Uncharacterized protein n=1 Tax=Arundo donax TaxID=35708 RepID=A0A0A9B5J4_ARUDO